MFHYRSLPDTPGNASVVAGPGRLLIQWKDATPVPKPARRVRLLFSKRA
jgi:hypothetical protein